MTPMEYAIKLQQEGWALPPVVNTGSVVINPALQVAAVITDAIEAAVLAEREACAKIADARYELVKDEDDMGEVSSNAVDCEMIARAIRSRGE